MLDWIVDDFDDVVVVDVAVVVDDDVVGVIVVDDVVVVVDITILFSWNFRDIKLDTFESYERDEILKNVIWIY